MLRSTTTGISAVIDARRHRARAGAAPPRRAARRPRPAAAPADAVRALRQRMLPLALAAALLALSLVARRRRRLERGSHKDFFISWTRDPCAATTCSPPKAFPKAIPTRSADQISDAIVDLFLSQGPRGAGRLRDADHHPAGRAGRRNPLQGHLRERRLGRRRAGRDRGDRARHGQARSATSRTASTGRRSTSRTTSTASRRISRKASMPPATRTKARATRASCSAMPRRDPRPDAGDALLQPQDPRAHGRRPPLGRGARSSSPTPRAR